MRDNLLGIDDSSIEYLSSLDIFNLHTVDMLLRSIAHVIKATQVQGRARESGVYVGDLPPKDCKVIDALAKIRDVSIVQFSAEVEVTSNLGGDVMEIFVNVLVVVVADRNGFKDDVVGYFAW